MRALRCNAFNASNSNDAAGPVVPRKLVSYKEHNVPMTVYTVRFRTAYERGSSMTDPNSGALICLTGKDGRSVLHRVSPVYDTSSARQDLIEICSDRSKIGSEKNAGVDCTIAPLLADMEAEDEAAAAAAAPHGSSRAAGAAPASSSSSSSSSGKSGFQRRFLEGRFDEVSFAAPELGDIDSLMVAPEAGTWQPEEIIIRSSQTGHTERFINRTRLGAAPRGRLPPGGGVVPAAQLRPVALDQVLYGSSPVSRREASALRQAANEEYEEMKERIFSRASVLVAGGSMLSGLTGDPQLFLSFLVGGLGSLAYGLATAGAVDSLQGPSGDQLEARYGPPTPPPSPEGPGLQSVDGLRLLGQEAMSALRPQASLQRVASSPATRLLLAVAIGAALGFVNLGPGYNPEDIQIEGTLEAAKAAAAATAAGGGAALAASDGPGFVMNLRSLLWGTVGLNCYKLAVIWEAFAPPPTPWEASAPPAPTAGGAEARGASPQGGALEDRTEQKWDREAGF